MKRRHFLRLAGGALSATALGCTHQVTDQIIPSSPRYVGTVADRGLFKAPYLQRDAHLFVFLLAADLQRLKQLCDTYLNVHSEGRGRNDRPFDYTPLAPYIFMLYADMKISSLDAHDQALGWMREIEISFWVPTVARAQSGGLLVPDHVAFFLPYLFVDNPYALLAGREVYGFPKMLGQIQAVEDYQTPAFALDVWGFQRFGPDEEGKVRRLLEVHPMQGEAGEHPTAAAPWRSWEEARRVLIQLLLDSGGRDLDRVEDATVLNALDQASLPVVFLKQFPDVADSGRACYQALVEAPVRVVDFHVGQRLEGTYQLILHDLVSHPLARTLGLAVQDGGHIQSLAALSLSLDFVLDHGDELWQTTK